MSIQDIPLDKIVDSPYQCRSSYSTTAIEDMAHSIKEIGLRQIPEARQRNGLYQLAFGHMRFRAYKKLAKKDKTITTMPLDVKEIEDSTMCLISLEENIRRQEITPIDIARSVEQYMSTFKDATETELARRLKMTQGHISNMRRVLRLPAEIILKVEEEKINFTMGRELLIFEGKTGIGSESKWSRKESRNISSAKDEKWLMLEAVRGVGGSYGPPATVDGIKKSIYQVCVSNFRHLYSDGHSYYSSGHNPLFDIKASGCLKCEHMIRANETKTQIRHFCTNAQCWDKLQAAHIKAQAEKAKKEMKADLAKRINEQEKAQAAKPAVKEAVKETISQEILPEDEEREEEARLAAEEAEEEFEEASAALTETFVDNAEALGIDEEVAVAIDPEQRDGALRTWSNMKSDPREVCCRTCLSAGVCDGRPKNLVGNMGKDEKWVCSEIVKIGSVEKLAQKAVQELPAAFKDLNKDAAGTRAEILDILTLRISSYGSELKQGHVWLNANTGFRGEKVLDIMENSQECLETCTKGFHYGFDSSAHEKEVLYICTDTKCVARKKSAFTRAKNARATAKKKAETAAIKEAVTATTTLDKPRLMLILTASRKGKHANSYSYTARDWEKQLARLLGFEIKDESYGSDGKNRDVAFQEAMEKLSEEELAKVVVHFMLLLLTYEGEIKEYKIKTTEVLNKMGIGITVPK